MTGIFLSYRRDDSQGEAHHLFDDLSKHLGQDQVFMDVTGIDPGKDFRKAIDGAVGSCDVLIVMIGKKWLDSMDDKGSRRLDDPKDFVRIETAAALRREISVIPVLVQGAAMPHSEQLPGDLEALAWRNAFEIRHARWEIDVAELLKALKKVVKTSATGAKPDAAEDKRSGHPIGKWPVALVLAVGGAAVGLVIYVLSSGGWPQRSSGPQQSTTRISQMEYGTNRFGGDYRSLEASAPHVCQDTCVGEARCLAFTFVKPGVQGPTGVCWLKDRVPPPNPDVNCISWIK